MVNSRRPEILVQENKNLVLSRVRPIVVIWLFMAVALVGLVFVYASDLLTNKSGNNSAANSGSYKITIAAKPIVVPKAWTTSTINTDDEVLSNVELAIPMNVSNDETALHISLLPSAKAAPSAYLLDSLYIHNFEEGAPKQAYGLIVKSLKPQAGYEDETIWYDAISANPFVAKCLEEKLGDDTQTNCITTMLVNKRVSALIRFDGDLLPYWKGLHAELTKLLPTFNRE